jgi:hypothetical protein
LGTFLKRLLFLLSDAQAAAAVLGVDVHHPGLLNRGTKIQEEENIAKPAKGAVLEAAKEPEVHFTKDVNVEAVVLPAKDPASSGTPEVKF